MNIPIPDVRWVEEKQMQGGKVVVGSRARPACLEEGWGCELKQSYKADTNNQP